MRRGAKIASGVALTVVLFILLPFWMAGVVVALAGGWISYLANVLPKVTVNWGGVGLLGVCLGLAAAVGHGFCRWLWRGTGHEEPWRPRWTLAGLGGVVLMFAAGMAVTGVAHQTGWLLRSPEPMTYNTGRASNDRNASASLKTLAAAQADFRANDRDGNREHDFWRGDIAGLYALRPEGGTEPIKLIDLSVALADDRPITEIEKLGTRASKAGYWFRALKFKGETTPDPDRFAACSFPSSPMAGRWMFIISNENTLYRKPFTGAPPEVYPDDPQKDGWTKLD